MKKYAYYPGCSLLSGAKEYDHSVRAVFARLGIDLVEIEDWNCCGAVHADVHNPDAALTLPARNLALAASQGLTELVAPCSGCYKNLRRASKAVASDKQAFAKVVETLAPHVSETLGSSASTIDVEVLHPLYVILKDYGLERVKEQVVRPLTGFRVASYYGCMLTRPKDRFDSPERPRGLDDLVRALGAEPVEYPMKAKCCGGALALSHSEVTARLTGNVLVSAKDAGADLVTLACPMCHTALDSYQRKAARTVKRQLDIPVLYFTQLMALALGMEPETLGFNRHIVSTAPVLERL